MINESITTASMTNQAFTQKSLTWDNADFTWDEAQGTWNVPENIKNESINTASMTNQPSS